MKNSWGQFKLGMSSYKKALKFIYQNKLSYFYLFPLLLNILLFLLVFWVSSSISGSVIEYVNSFLPENANASWWLDIINTTIGWTVWLAIRVLLWYVFALIGGYITIILMAPVLTYLSEKTAEIMTGDKIHFDVLQLTRDILRASLIAIRNMIIQFGFMLLFFIISFIPFVGWIISFVGNFLVSSYFYGFSFMDYTNERNKLSVKESILFVRKNKWYTMGLGSVFSVFFLVPCIGPIVASFATIVSVVGATITLEEMKQEAKAAVQ